MVPPLSLFPFHRRRPFIALLILLTIAIGLWTRSHVFPFSPFSAKYGGDALWAITVFLGCGFIFQRLSPARLAALALAIAWSVEFLQLYHTPWLDSLRSSRLGALALGYAFNAPDLIAYAIGIAVVFALESLWIIFPDTTSPRGVSENAPRTR